MSENSNPFDGQAIRDVRYHRADMTGSNFDGVNLTEARFYAVLARAVFTDTDLSNATFDDVNLAGTTFTNVNLAGIAVKDANLANATIDDADLTGMRINGILVTDLLLAHERMSQDPQA